MKYFARVIALILLFSAASVAQSAAPVLSDIDRVRIENIELRAEVLTLRIASAQQELQRLQVEAKAYFESLKRDGYSVARQSDGAWAYAPDQPK